MDRSPPPFFKQGPSANARLAFFTLLGLALLMIDARTGLLSAMRQGVGTVLYPLQRGLLLPRDTLSMTFDYVGDIARLRTENSELRRIEAANARQLLQVEQLTQENRQLREVMQARDRSAVKSVVAEVLYDTQESFAETGSGVIIGIGDDHADARYRCAGDCGEITYDQIVFATI